MLWARVPLTHSRCRRSGTKTVTDFTKLSQCAKVDVGSDGPGQGPYKVSFALTALESLRAENARRADLAGQWGSRLMGYAAVARGASR